MGWQRQRPSSNLGLIDVGMCIVALKGRDVVQCGLQWCVGTWNVKSVSVRV